MPHLAAIYRHPIKSLGVEALGAADLVAGQPFPQDRVWALTHAGSSYDPLNPVWVACDAFLRVTQCPRLAQVRARLEGETVHLSHPDQPDLTARPDTPEGATAIAAWAAPLVGPNRRGPFGIAHVPGRALTDVADSWVSLKSLASLRALGDLCGLELDPIRFRGNLWVEGWEPWAERDMIGQDIRIGAATLRVREAVVRCAATKANPETGLRDAQTIETLFAQFGHRDFGVYAEVMTGGTVALGDPVSA